MTERLAAIAAAAGAGFDAAWAELHAAAGYAAAWALGMVRAGRHVVDDPFGLAAALVVALFLAHVLIIVYTAWLRATGALAARRRRRRFAAWRAPLAAYLDGESDASALAATIRRRDLPLFGAFVRPLLGDLAGEDKARLVALMHTLGAADRLQHMLARRNEWERAFAAHLLGLIEAHESIGALRALLAHRSELVRFAAAEALVALHDADALPILLGWLNRPGGARTDRIAALVYQFGPSVCPVLHRLLRDAPLGERAAILAVDGLGHYVYIDAAWDILELAVRTPSREVRLAALRALAAFEDATLAAFFEEVLGDPDAAARAIAARALGRIGRPGHARLLVPLLAEDDFWVAREAVAALGELGPAGRDWLETAVREGRTSSVTAALIDEAHAAQTLRA